MTSLNKYNFKCSSTIDDIYKIKINLQNYIEIKPGSAALLSLETINFPNNYINNYGYQEMIVWYKKGTIDEIERHVNIPLSNYNLESLLKTICKVGEECYADKPEKWNIDYVITDYKESMCGFYVSKELDNTHNAYLLSFVGNHNAAALCGFIDWHMFPITTIPILVNEYQLQNVPADSNFICGTILVKLNAGINVSTNLFSSSIGNYNNFVSNQPIIYMFNSMSSTTFSMIEKIILTDNKIQITDTLLKDLSIEFKDINDNIIIPIDTSALCSVDMNVEIINN